MGYKDIKLQKERVRKFLRKNSKATWEDIKTNLHIHLERVYKNGMIEAFKDAGIKPPRNFKRKTLEENRRIIINYIKEHPNTSSHKILKNTKVNPSTFFNSIKDAFDVADIVYTRDIKKVSNNNLVKKVITKRSSIPKNKKINFHSKQFKLKNKKKKDKKIKPREFIKDTKKFYAQRKAVILRNKQIRIINRENKKKEIIELIKEDSLITIPEIMEKTKTHIDFYFKNMKEIYDKAGIKFIDGHKKQKLRKIRLVINYIKRNNLATQKEINWACKTHVQEIFNKGIFEAYKMAGIDFPYDRLRLYGTATKKIRKRSENFENLISTKLKGYGKVNRLVRTKRGIADIIFERKDKKAIIEVKDYQAKDISISQVNQLLKYLEDCNCNLGILICHKKPKKDKFLIGNNKIFVIEKTELNRIPEIMGL